MMISYWCIWLDTGIVILFATLIYLKLNLWVCKIEFHQNTHYKKLRFFLQVTLKITILCYWFNSIFFRRICHSLFGIAQIIIQKMKFIQLVFVYSFLQDTTMLFIYIVIFIPWYIFQGIALILYTKYQINQYDLILVYLAEQHLLPHTFQVLFKSIYLYFMSGIWPNLSLKYLLTDFKLI